MKLDLDALKNTAGWKAAGVALPGYDIAKMRERTLASPVWLHFGAGNIFRIFIAGAVQKLLNAGDLDRGIIAADTFDADNIRVIFRGHDHLTLGVTLNADASLEKEVIASVADALVAQPEEKDDFERLMDTAAAPSLQIISFTITEKGYALKGIAGAFSPRVAVDLKNGPGAPRHAMTVLTALLLRRFEKGGAPVAVVSMDNCSHNGEKLRNAALTVAEAWEENGFTSPAFTAWLKNEDNVSFPWTMIDKITPRPAPQVQKALESAGIEGMAPVRTPGGTYAAAFVNAEKPQDLVVEDRFPNGRPPLEKAGVYMTDRNTVNKVERMKVTTCLNPLHTALAVYGCLLGYTLIADEMKDEDLKALVTRLGYVEGLPVVTHPGILDPESFLGEVVNVRLPNPFMPDTPQRIATDTSQKVGIRFGETVRSYLSEGRSTEGLTALPLAIAGWLRYLMGVDDTFSPMPLSPDPMLSSLTEALKGIEPGRPETCGDKLDPILKNPAIFGTDLTQCPLGEKITEMFRYEISGPGAVRAALQKYLSHCEV